MPLHPHAPLKCSHFTCTHAPSADSDADAIVELIGEGHVQKLSLAHNNLGPEAAFKIAGALEENKSLTWLSMHSNAIGHNGAMAFAKALQGANTTLTSLFLSANDLPAESKGVLNAVNEARGESKLTGLNGLVL